jgi:DNA-binding XRE family transcriptional regulator
MQRDAQCSRNSLKRVRRAHGLAQYGLAAQAGVSPTMVSAIERWNYHPTAAVCQRIAAALGVQVADIWPGQGECLGEPIS